MRDIRCMENRGTWCELGTIQTYQEVIDSQFVMQENVLFYGTSTVTTPNDAECEIFSFRENNQTGGCTAPGL